MISLREIAWRVVCEHCTWREACTGTTLTYEALCEWMIWRGVTFAELEASALHGL